MKIRQIVALTVTASALLSRGLEAQAQTTCSSGTYCAGWENNYSGVGSSALFGQANVAGNTGVFGNASGGFGVYGADASNGTGVYGTSSSYYGVQGISSTGSGVYGQSGSGTANGVAGVNTTYGPGVVGNSHSGVGVVALSGGAVQPSGIGAGILANGTGTSVYGGYFESSSKNAVYGVSTSDNAIWGDISAQSGSTKAAVYGNAGSSGGWGIYSNGPAKVSGNLTVTGTVTCMSGCSSDARLKKKIAPLSGALEQLLQLKGVTFEWNVPSEHEGHEGTQVGVIAQDVQKVQPQWVHEVHEDGGKSYLTVDPDARTVVALTVESVRALKAENDALKARMDRMENVANPPRAGFTYGNGGWAVAGLAIGLTVMSRRKQQTA